MTFRTPRIQDYLDHFSGCRTLYYHSDGNPKAPYALVMIDIDCHKHGTLEGAQQFARLLSEIFPGLLYWETSTNGNGVHAYIRIHKLGSTAAEVNTLIKTQLQPYLQNLAAEAKADIELVECKGTCPVIDWQYGQIKDIRYGQFAKMPRELNARLNEFENTTVFTVQQIQQLRGEQPPAQSHKLQGSHGGVIVTEAMLAQVPAVARVLEPVLAEHQHELQLDRREVTSLDAALWLLCQHVFKLHPNKKGHNPMARMGGRSRAGDLIGLWPELYRLGLVTRQYHPDRASALRNLFSKLGHIHWQSNDYDPQPQPDTHHGVACCWSISPELSSLYSPEETAEVKQTHRESTCLPAAKNKAFPGLGTGENLRPVRRDLLSERQKVLWRDFLAAHETLCEADTYLAA